MITLLISTLLFSLLLNLNQYLTIKKLEKKTYEWTRNNPNPNTKPFERL